MKIQIKAIFSVLVMFALVSCGTEKRNIKDNNMQVTEKENDETTVTQTLSGKAGARVKDAKIMAAKPSLMKQDFAGGSTGDVMEHENGTVFNTEAYDNIVENRFQNAKENPLSTFSADVDTASYSNMRRFLNMGQMPPKDAVRIEEMVNYFDYDYNQPKDGKPFSVTMEMGKTPWNEKSVLLHVGIKGRSVEAGKIPPRNLVFLLDVSGSMSDANKLPLLKQSLKLLTQQMDDRDRVSIVVYAGASGVVLNPTPGSDQQKIIDALSRLEAGGSTNGGAGIELAYKLAEQNFRKDGINRVILATDGDFNVGTTSQGDLIRLIEEKRKSGVFLTVLGFGMGNVKDSTMEKLADKGNGNYAYIDTIQEARKVLVHQAGSTLITIAKDVKFQIEFNPSKVKEYRLIGYESRILKHEDFNNDKIDAGDIGAGHTVTVLYEIVPADGKAADSQIDKLKYQTDRNNVTSGEWLQVKIRHKNPDSDKSQLNVYPFNGTVAEKTTDNFRFSAAAAILGMSLRNSEFKGTGNYDMAYDLGRSALGKDNNGYRAEFLKLAKTAKEISPKS